MSEKTNLPDVLAKLERAVKFAEDELNRQIWDNGQSLYCTPEMMRDSSGRYILLDAYAALVNAHAALHRHG